MSQEGSRSRLLDTLYEDIFDHIFSYLTAYDLLRSRRLCKQFKSLVDSYSARSFSISRIYSPYFSESQIIDFRNLQRESGLIVSGSAAVQFFGRIIYPSSDLDTYVHILHGRSIADFLVSCGYNFVPQKFQDDSFDATYTKMESSYTQDSNSSALIDDDYFNIGILGVFFFVKTIDENVSRKIQVIISESPVVGAVLQFHSTCVMNIITHANAICLFPKTTFDLYQSMVVAPFCISPPGRPEHQERREAGVEKYRQRGWSLVYPSPTIHVEMKIAENRRVGDKFCWTIPLPPLPTTSTSSDFSRDMIFIDSFTVSQMWLNDKLQGSMRSIQHEVFPYLDRNHTVISNRNALRMDYLIEDLIDKEAIPHVRTGQYDTVLTKRQKDTAARALEDAWLEKMKGYLP